MQLIMEYEDVASREDLVEFIRTVIVPSLVEDRDDWENRTVHDYLLALARWITDSPGAYANHGLQFPDPPDWSFIAAALNTATDYE